MSIRRLRLIAYSTILATAALATSAALAQGETFQVVDVVTTGCNSGNFGMTVERANLDGGSYTVHTYVEVDGLSYMNEAATISVNGLSGWNVFNNFTYGPVPNPGTYPIPAGQMMQLDFTLERPIGTPLYAWTLIVDGCDTGNILYNGLPAAPSFPTIPTLSQWGLVLFAALLLAAFFWLQKARRGAARP
jgi:hypothetical protein